MQLVFDILAAMLGSWMISIIIYTPIVWFTITHHEKRVREERRERLRTGLNPVHAPTVANRYDTHARYSRTFCLTILGFWLSWAAIAVLIYTQLYN